MVHCSHSEGAAETLAGGMIFAVVLTVDVVDYACQICVADILGLMRILEFLGCRCGVSANSHGQQRG